MKIFAAKAKNKFKNFYCKRKKTINIFWVDFSFCKSVKRYIPKSRKYNAELLEVIRSTFKDLVEVNFEFIKPNDTKDGFPSEAEKFRR